MQVTKWGSIGGGCMGEIRKCGILENLKRPAPKATPRPSSPCNGARDRAFSPSPKSPNHRELCVGVPGAGGGSRVPMKKSRTSERIGVDSPRPIQQHPIIAVQRRPSPCNRLEIGSPTVTPLHPPHDTNGISDGTLLYRTTRMHPLSYPGLACFHPHTEI